MRGMLALFILQLRAATRELSLFLIFLLIAFTGGRTEREMIANHRTANSHRDNETRSALIECERILIDFD